MADLCSRPWWAHSRAAVASSVNKRWLRQLPLLLLLGVLSAGRGGEGQDTDGDKESVEAGKTSAATSSYLTVTTRWSSILDAQDWHQSTQGKRRSNLLRRPSDGATATPGTGLLPSGYVLGEDAGGRRRSSSPCSGLVEGPDCFSAIFLEVLFAKSRDLSVIFLFLVSHHVTCTTALTNAA
jgi:hypothetical protein